MDDEASLLIQEYYKSNQYNHKPDHFSCSRTQGNPICGDSIAVYITIENDIITAYGYDGEPAQITKAAAEFLGEFIVGEKTLTILTRDADRVRSQGFEVSHRRIRSSVSALLSARNAIHVFLHDGQREEYEDLID